MRFGIGHRRDPNASDSYLSYYQLSSAPFAATTEAGFLFLDPERRQTLDMLQHLIQYNDEVLLVSGESGLGKSTLCQALLQRAEAHWRCCHIDGAQVLQADELFSRLAACFDLNLQGISAEQLLSGIQAQLNALQEQRLAVLMVDDVQLLGEDALELILHLAQLEGDQGKLIRLVLFGEPQIASRLAAPRYAVLPAAHRIELHALSEEATTQYVLHRLQAAGAPGGALLDAREFKHIYRHSKGLPGAINQQAQQLLEQKYRQSQRGGKRQGLKLGIAATAILGTVLGLHGRVYEWIGMETHSGFSVSDRPVVRLSEQTQPWAVVIRDGESIQISCGATDADTVGVRPTLSSAVLSEPATSLARPLLTSTRLIDEPVEASVAVAEAEQAEPPVPIAEISQPLVVPAEPLETVEAVEAVEAVELVLRQIEPNPVVANQQFQTLTIRGRGFMPGSKLALSRAGQVDVLPDQQVHFIDAETMDIEVNPGASSAGWAIQLSTPDERRSNVLRFQVVSEARLPTQVEVESPPAVQAHEPVPEPVTEPAESAPVAVEVGPPATAPVVPATSPAAETSVPLLGIAGVEAGEWLAAQPAGNYTVQLMVSAQQESLAGLIDRHRLPAPLVMFGLQRDAEQLYGLTQGSYPNRAAAERAAAALPAGVQSWVRSIASVQEVMQQTPQPSPAPAVTRPAPAPTAAATGRSAMQDLAGVKDDAWVWSQDPARYTIQLVAAANEQTIREAMQALNLPGERVVVQTLRDGRPWYVIIYGSFADRETARATIARLPPALQASSPWPRGFASLQDEMGRSTVPR